METGVLLAVAPWTVWWRRNLFAETLPWVSQVMAAPAARWLVVGLGIVTFVGGLIEARGLFGGTRT